MQKHAWLLALLMLTACGGPADEPGGEAGAAADLPASAERDALEPELVATAPDAPTTGRFELGVVAGAGGMGPFDSKTPP